MQKHTEGSYFSVFFSLKVDAQKSLIKKIASTIFYIFTELYTIIYKYMINIFDLLQKIMLKLWKKKEAKLAK